MREKKQAPKWPDHDEWMPMSEALVFVNSRLPRPIVRRTVYRWIAEGKIKAVIAAEKRYISRSSLEEFLNPVNI